MVSIEDSDIKPGVFRSSQHNLSGGDKPQFFKYLLRLGWKLYEIHPEWQKIKSNRSLSGIHKDVVNAYETHGDLNFLRPLKRKLSPVRHPRKL